MLTDLRYAFRQLVKNPGFTAVVVLTLALGIGANTAIFSFVNGVLLKPLPYAAPDRIVRVLEKPPSGGRNGISTLNYLDWERDNKVFEYMAAQTGGSVTLTGIDEPMQLRGARVSAHYFDIFGASAALGRTFVHGEDQIGNDHVVVLSHALWATRFGSDTQLIGRAIQLDGEPYTVIGVLAKDSSFDRSYNQLWRPLSFAPENRTRDFHWFGSVARLKPGVTFEKAQANMDAIGARIAQDFPDSNKGWGVGLDRLADIIVGKQLRQSLYVLLVAVGMVLLIACANVANLTLARGMAREREVAIRASLGAGRMRLIRQFLTESVMLSLLGGALGLAMGNATIAGLKAALPPYSLPSEADITMDGRVLLFTIALALLTGLLCGLVPAFQATRPDLANATKQGGPNASTGRTRQKVRGALVVAEVALAFVLLTGASLLIRSFFALQKVEVGLDPTNVITAYLPIPEKRFPEQAALIAYLRQIQDGLGALPGVRDVAFTSALPMGGWGYGMPFQIADRAVVDRAHREDCFFKMVTAPYFRTVGINLIKGRGLSERDVKGSSPVCVINDTMVRKYFPNEDPIGKRILIQEIAFGKSQLGPEIPWEVIGIVADEKVGELNGRGENPGLYVTTEQSPRLGQGLVVRGAMDPALLQKTIRTAIHSINRDQTLTDMKTLEQIKIESMGDDRLRSLLLSVFASVALLLSAIGIYGVISYSVVQRTREIGIRSALGARAGNILRLVLRSGMTLVAIGLVLGGVAVIGLTRLLSSFLFGVGERDPSTIVGVAVILSAVALLACWLPARRATKVDPIIALRSE